MKRIGIVGGGISGLHLGLWLREYGLDATIYSEKTSSQLLDAPLRNIVIRNGCTRQRERDLRVNHWDGRAPDLGGLSVTVAGTPIAFAGTLAPPSNVVDMRIYCARLLDDFSTRGGHVVVGTLAASDLDELSTRHDLLVIASGRGSLSNVFERVPEHSPNSEPQRLVVAGFYRGIRPRDPLGFEVVISRGHGEILVFPLFSFESGLTGLGIEAIRGGAFSRPVRGEVRKRSAAVRTARPRYPSRPCACGVRARRYRRVRGRAGRRMSATSRSRRLCAGVTGDSATAGTSWRSATLTS